MKGADSRAHVVKALLEGRGYEDAAVAGEFSIAEARAIFRELSRAGVLANIVRRSRQLRAEAQQ